MYLTPAHWKLISVLCKVLKPFELAMCEISSDTVIPVIRLIQKHLEKLKGEFQHTNHATYVGLVNQALNALSQDPRAVNLLQSEHYVLATILDPRFKSYALLPLLPPSPNLQRCKQLLLRNLASESELGTYTSPPSVSHSFPKRRTTETQSGNVSDIWSGLKEMSTTA